MRCCTLSYGGNEAFVVDDTLWEDTRRLLSLAQHLGCVILACDAVRQQLDESFHCQIMDHIETAGAETVCPPPPRAPHCSGLCPAPGRPPTAVGHPPSELCAQSGPLGGPIFFPIKKKPPTAGGQWPNAVYEAPTAGEGARSFTLPVMSVTSGNH